MTVEKEIIQFIASKLQNSKLSMEDHEICSHVLSLLSDLDKFPTCHKLVNEYLNKHNITILPNGIYKQGDLVRNHKVLFYKIHEEWKAIKSLHRVKAQISKEDIALEFEAIKEKHWDIKRDELRKSLKPTPDLNLFKGLIHELTVAICGTLLPDHQSPQFRRSKAFLAHFIWQVQTKLHMGPEEILKTGHESMLLLYSSQQKTGKSTTIRYLISPFKEFGYVWDTDFTRLGDDFSLHNLAYNYIASFDDAGRATMRDMARFKRIVTDPEVSFRAMYTQTEITMPKNATLLGTSNKRIRELMHDTTGLRRFHEIHVNQGKVHEGTGIDLEKITKFDWKRLYKTCPIGSKHNLLFEFITPEELDEYEDEIRPRHVVELWEEEMGYSAHESDDGEIISVNDLYDSFIGFCSENGYSGSFVPTSESFRHKLLDMGYVAGRTAKKRGLKVYYKDIELESEKEND